MCKIFLCRNNMDHHVIITDQFYIRDPLKHTIFSIHTQLMSSLFILRTGRKGISRIQFRHHSAVCSLNTQFHRMKFPVSAGRMDHSKHRRIRRKRECLFYDKAARFSIIYQILKTLNSNCFLHNTVPLPLLNA